MNLAEIQQYIPHRPPFLWLDEVTDISEKRITALKHVSESLDVFQGHYPGFPVLPGVLQCEMAMQAAAILIAKNDPPEAGKVPVATRMNSVQFRRMIKPGETVQIDVELTEKLGQAWFLTGKVSVDGKVATRLEFACTLADAPA
ncbi:MAG: 3-hydroxyacyl-ACP dehydratase FabZ [Planctomycetaceae bacterium]|nr:3-hydroxyacyl-ACP dehydratase FabZ [Planctomycetaceae bacterium]